MTFTNDDLTPDALSIGTTRKARKAHECTGRRPWRGVELRYATAAGWSGRRYRTPSDAWAALVRNGAPAEMVSVPNPEWSPHCVGTIEPGTRYFEDISEAEHFHGSGTRRCEPCCRQHGYAALVGGAS